MCRFFSQKKTPLFSIVFPILVGSMPKNMAKFSRFPHFSWFQSPKKIDDAADIGIVQVVVESMRSLEESYAALPDRRLTVSFFRCSGGGKTNSITMVFIVVPL